MKLIAIQTVGIPKLIQKGVKGDPHANPPVQEMKDQWETSHLAPGQEFELADEDEANQLIRAGAARLAGDKAPDAVVPSVTKVPSPNVTDGPQNNATTVGSRKTR